MATLNTKSFSAIVSNFATAVQGRASSLIDFSVGSVLLAIGEAMGGVALWLQGVILQVAALSRAATSNGADLDSWFAQFGFTRLAAKSGTVQESFYRYTPTSQAIIPVGATVATEDGSVQYAVIADTTNAAYSASAGGYVLPAGQASVNVTMQCTVAGTVGNVAAASLNTLSKAISWVDYVSNTLAVENGEAAETDTAARSRFVLYIASLEAATLLAVKNAIASVQNGMFGIIAENKRYDGTNQNGYFTAIVNNGGGAATSTEIANASSAIEGVRPLTVTYGVFGPTTSVITVSLTITVADGYVKATQAASAQTAISKYIAGIVTTDAGATLPWSAIGAQAWGIDGVTNVSNVLVNGGTTDVVIGYQQAFQPGTITVN